MREYTSLYKVYDMQKNLAQEYYMLALENVETQNRGEHRAN